MEEARTTNVFDRWTPIASVIFGFLALFAQGTPDWVQYIAISIGFLLASAFCFSKVGWIGKAIKFRLFQSKLTKDQAIRLSVLLDDISNQMSYSFTLSPFYVWHSLSNKYSDKLRMNYKYHGAICSWLTDLNQRFNDPRNNTLLLVGSLSKAIVECAGLAEQVENDLNHLMQENGVSENEKITIQKDWESARGHFNKWIDKWQTLFREIDKTVGNVTHYYVRPLGMIG